VVEIGKRIQECRRARGLSQDELAELALLNRVTVAKYESGKVEPGVRAMLRIAAALEMSVGELLNSEELPASAPSDSQDEERTLLATFRHLNSIGRKKVRDYVADLAGNPAYLEDEKEKAI